MHCPATGDDWIGLTDEPLPVELAASWAIAPRCGAVVSFVGTVRDHSEGRPGVRALAYEAYAERVEPRLADVAQAARRRWPSIGRVALLHRIGCIAVGEASVAVVVSTPHRAEAFEAARFCIDTIKTAVPIWKKELWVDGAEWALGARAVEGVRREQG